MTNIHIAICDDDKTFLELIKSKIIEYYRSQNLTPQITDFANGKDLVKACKETEFDLAFLDIEMPQMTGIEVIKKLRDFCYDMEIIFLTNYENYVFESFKYNVFRYIRKSKIDIELVEALEAFQLKMKHAERYYSFTTTEGMVSWRVDDIQYMEVFQHYIYIHKKDRVIKVRNSLNKYEKEFEKFGFIRIHKSYLVSYRHIYSINTNEVVLMNNKKLPLSRNRSEYVKEKFIMFTRRLN